MGAFPDRASALRLFIAVALKVRAIWSNSQYADVALLAQQNVEQAAQRKCRGDSPQLLHRTRDRTSSTEASVSKWMAAMPLFEIPSIRSGTCF